AEAKARGTAALLRRDLDAARAEYSTALALDPSDPAHRGNRSHARLEAGDAVGALEDAEAVVSASPQWARGHGRLGAALSALGRHDEAVAAIERGQALHPEAALGTWLSDQFAAVRAARDRASTAVARWPLGAAQLHKAAF